MKRIVIIVVGLALTITSQAQAKPHFLWHHKHMTLEQKVRYFERSVAQDKWAISYLTHKKQSPAVERDLDWYRAALKWHKNLYAQYHAKLPVPAPVVYNGDWSATLYCETGGTNDWHTNTGNGYYGGLQFDHQTWISHGGGAYASDAHLATPAQQMAIASRLNYDAWPNCPNP